MQVVLFSFEHRIGLPDRPRWGDGWVELFKEVHLAINELAYAHPEITFYIKPKIGKGTKEWIRRIKETFDYPRVKNLFITNISAYNLIFNCDVICGFNSTTILQASITGKPIIIPYFAEAFSYSEYVLFKDKTLYDICESKIAFQHKILERLLYPEISEDCIKKRWKFFNEKLSPIDGTALQKTTKAIVEIIQNSKK